MGDAESEAAPEFSMESEYRERVGRSKKFGDLWFSVNKRIYIHESTLRLREIKGQNNLISDDEVVHMERRF